METIEERGRKRARKRNFKKAILKTLAITGVISIALIAPNVLGAMRKLGVPLLPSDTTSIARARKRLVQDGFVTYDGTLLRLTTKGEAYMRKTYQHGYAIKKPRRWDGRWRVLIFDIPERQRRTRRHIRETLHMLGFERLQDSVWIYPHDCEHFVTLLKADFKMGRELLYLIVDELEHDKPIRKLFNL